MTDTLATLGTVLQHAESERDQAVLLLRQADGSARAAQGQCDQLHHYRGDYQRRWTQRFGESGAIELLHCYRGFTLRLDQAIEQQTLIAAQATARAEQARAALVQREQRVASVRKLIERRQAEMQLKAHRRDQKTSDESAQRRHALHAASSGP